MPPRPSVRSTRKRSWTARPLWRRSDMPLALSAGLTRRRGGEHLCRPDRRPLAADARPCGVEGASQVALALVDPLAKSLRLRLELVGPCLVAAVDGIAERADQPA